MAPNAYLRLKGAKHGDVAGSVTQRGRESSIMVIAFNHEVSAPPTQKPQHTPVIITKELDKSSPVLMDMLLANEIITGWELRFWRPARSGQEEQYYTIQLKNATIIDIRQEMLNNKVPENGPYAPWEHVAFRYEKITWTWEPDHLVAEGYW